MSSARAPSNESATKNINQNRQSIRTFVIRYDLKCCDKKAKRIKKPNLNEPKNKIIWQNNYLEFQRKFKQTVTDLIYLYTYFCCK